MDYDKLIEELYDGAHPQNKNWKAATAIETLRADKVCPYFVVAERADDAQHGHSRCR